MGKFDGKVCLVGGNLGKFKKEGEFAMGLGAYIAKALVAEGGQVVVVDLDFKVAEACAKAIGGKIKAKDCDLMKDRVTEIKEVPDEKSGGTKKEAIFTENLALNLCKDIVAEFGKIDVVIPNFDFFEQKRIDNMEDALFNQLREQNVMPTFHLLAGVREQLASQCKANGTYAKVVLITSFVGKAGMMIGAVYSAFKGGLIGLNKALCREFGRFANVNAIACGPFSDKNLQGPKERIKKAYIATSTDMSNQDITPEKVVPAVLFLASDDAMGIAGQTLSVDGGIMAQVGEIRRE